MNEQGGCRLRRARFAPPGEAQEDWQIFVNLGLALGRDDARTHQRGGPRATRGGDVRQSGVRGLATMGFARPVSARHWLQASNPSERWKWDFMFQDLPPVKLRDVQPRDAALQSR